MARRRSAVLTVRVSPDERERFGAAAQLDGALDLSVWARRILLLEANRLVGPTDTPARGITVRELLGQFCTTYTSPTVRCIDSYRYDAKCLLDTHALPVLGDHDAERLTARDVADLRDRILAKRSRQTARHVMARLSRAFRWAQTQQLIRRKDNPVDDVDRPTDPCRGQPITPDEWLNTREIQAILAWTKANRPGDLTLYALAIYTGLRFGELAALTWADIVASTIHVRTSKTGRGRTVPIPDACKPWLGQPGPAPTLVCPGPHGRKRNRNYTGKRWREACRSSGIKQVRFHACRHTFASHLAMAGVPEATIARLLGHTTTQTTRRYMHLADDHLTEAVNRPQLVKLRKR